MPPACHGQVDACRLYAMTRYVACQDEQKGILVLSEFTGVRPPPTRSHIGFCHTSRGWFAGAAQALGAGCLRVNPYNIEELARYMAEAIAMPTEQRDELHAYASQYVSKFTSQVSVPAPNPGQCAPTTRSLIWALPRARRHGPNASSRPWRSRSLMIYAARRATPCPYLSRRSSQATVRRRAACSCSVWVGPFYRRPGPPPMTTRCSRVSKGSCLHSCSPTRPTRSSSHRAALASEWMS